MEENGRTYAAMLKKAQKSLSRSESSLEDFTSRFNTLQIELNRTVKRNLSRLDSKISRLESENARLARQLGKQGNGSAPPRKPKAPATVRNGADKLKTETARAYHTSGMRGACDRLASSKLPYMEQAFILSQVLGGRF